MDFAIFKPFLQLLHMLEDFFHLPFQGVLLRVKGDRPFGLRAVNRAPAFFLLFALFMRIT